VAQTESQQTVRAQAKWVRTSARKARLVTDHIRGRRVPEARTVLAFTPRAAAREVEKVLSSAVANAEANHGLVGDRLVVASAVVDDGPTLKRWRARARGRVARIRKRTCHITVVLSPAGSERVDRAARPAPSPPAPETPTAALPEPEAPAEQEPAEETPVGEDKPKQSRKPRRAKAEPPADEKSEEGDT
jgi:ribosomal protein L22